MMRKGGKPKQYVDMYLRMFLGNGLVSGRDSFFLYLTETIPVGTSVHLALTFTSMDSTATSLQVRDTAASAADITIPMPADSVDVEFVTSNSSTNILWCYFDKSVTNVQIDTTKTKVEKII